MSGSLCSRLEREYPRHDPRGTGARELVHRGTEERDPDDGEREHFDPQQEVRRRGLEHPVVHGEEERVELRNECVERLGTAQRELRQTLGAL
jgi:hypothetical protein